tara:strand:+ start:75 stop:359 length:285 start_codon:yes stop_codon:yes gene_type:complete
VTEIPDSSIIPDRLKEREKWHSILHAAWMFHQQMVKESKPTILGDAAKKMADDHMFHQAISVAIMDAMNLIQQMEALGYFDDDEGLLSAPGPAG